MHNIFCIILFASFPPLNGFFFLVFCMGFVSASLFLYSGKGRVSRSPNAELEIRKCKHHIPAFHCLARNWADSCPRVWLLNTIDASTLIWNDGKPDVRMIGCPSALFLEVFILVDLRCSGYPQLGFSFECGFFFHFFLSEYDVFARLASEVNV